VKAVFFDWDGTLVDSLPTLFAAHNHVRSLYDLPLWTREEYAKAMILSTRELYPSIFGERALEAQTRLYDYIHANHLQNLVVIEGAAAMIEELAARGIPMGVVSNKRDDVLKKEVEHLGWQKYFGVYNGAGVAEKDKPSCAPLLYALKQHPLPLDIRNVLYVGDTESDLSCAKEAGCKVAFLMHPPLRDDLVSRYRPAYTARTMAELKACIWEYLAA
jgi:phosphoglycolate phosphatase